MVKGSPKNSKWMRRYKTFFVIGIVILSSQLYLTLKFLSISRNSVSDESQWQGLNFENDDQELESYSAGKIKVESDDEDTGVTPKNNKKSNQTYTLRYGELDFIPPCKITGKEAVSAINRAKTQACKQLISNITCFALENKLYPTELKGSCPAKGLMSGRELGCFKDEKHFRLLNGYYGINQKTNSPVYCLKLCLQSGFPYAGVQYGNECFCGIDEPPLSSKVPDSSCNLKCPGDQHATCGGYYTMNIFQTGIKKFIPQAANLAAKNGTAQSVKIVFLLTLNGRAVRQVKRLLKILYHKDHYYYIHVDIRQDYLYRQLLLLEQLLPNVRLTRRRFATIWGGASLLEMLRSCMWELLNTPEWHWDFVLNLSESDYPVKTIARLTAFLSLNKDLNFVKSHGREVQRFIQKQGLDKTFVECETRMWRVGDRSLPYGIQVDGGSDWVALSRRFVEYVANPTPDDLISGLLRIFKHTLLPAESFFHTALRNSIFCETYVDNNLHVTNWKRKLGCKCQYKHVVDWCGCSPNDFRPEDWSRIQNTASRHLYFARKFEPIINQGVVLQLELWLFGLEAPRRRVRGLYAYWQNIYHFRDLGVNPDDALLTLGNSIKRHISNYPFCRFDLNELHEVHSFHHNDTYNYTLFSFKNVEVAIRPVNHVTFASSSIDKLTISSEYDQKEQIFRNFLQVLTPYSEPVLGYRFSLKPTKTYNLTSLWINPTGSLEELLDFSIEEIALTGHVKPSLKQPISPGIWRVLLIHKDTQLAEVKFLILPLEYQLGSAITKAKADIVNAGTKTKRILKSSFEKFLPKPDERLLHTAERHGGSLEAWVDELFSQFYKIERICATSVESICSEVKACIETEWSSYSPDPKSAIAKINETTGTFDIW